MEVLRKANWSKINEAYQVFINTGEIIPNTVRPEIERSWRRSKEKGVNPWRPRPQPIPQPEFSEVVVKNARLLEVARPVMQFMYATNNQKYEDNIVHLSEKDGIVLYFCSRVCAYPSPLGKKLTESTIGTSISALVQEEQMPFEVGGAEQYSVCYQTNYGGGAPIKDPNGNLIGALLFYNNYGKIPEHPLEFVISGALLIEDLLKCDKTAKKKTLTSNGYFTDMLNYVNDYILIVDGEGQILNINEKIKELLELDQKEIIGKHCGDFGIELGELISDASFRNKDIFSVKTNNRHYDCHLENNRTIKWFDNKEYTLLLFSVYETHARRLRMVYSKIQNKDYEIDTFDKIVGSTSSYQKVINIAKRAARVDAAVLLEGESGTGKEVFARAIHNASRRASKPFVAINCGAIPKEIIQSELFGYEEGAFTGGKKGGQIGKFEAADGGTLFLDEIGEMPLEMQVNLLRFLEDKTVVRLGQSKGKKVDVRVIAATNKNLRELVAAGLFREDLYYRLKVISIVLPPLRERKDDILILAEYYVQYYSNLYGLGKISLAQETRDILYRYSWPGNIRELAHVIENAVIFCEGEQIYPELLPPEILEYQPWPLAVDEKEREHQEKEIIGRALVAAKGNVSQAAKIIGISRNTLYRKMDKYGLHFLR